MKNEAMSDDEDNNSHLRRLYRDTIVGQAYMNTLDELVDELGGIDEEMKEKMVCVFEQVRTTFFFSSNESHCKIPQMTVFYGNVGKNR